MSLLKSIRKLLNKFAVFSDMEGYGVLHVPSRTIVITGLTIEEARREARKYNGT